MGIPTFRVRVRVLELGISYQVADFFNLFGFKLPRTIPCYEWSGIAHELSSRCLHREPCLRLVAFDSTDTGRRFLACAQEKVCLILLYLVSLS